HFLSTHDFTPSSAAFALLSAQPTPFSLRYLPSPPTRRSSDLPIQNDARDVDLHARQRLQHVLERGTGGLTRAYHDCHARGRAARSEEHTSELQSRENLVCRLLLEKKKLFRRHRSGLSLRHAKI